MYGMRMYEGKTYFGGGKNISVVVISSDFMNKLKEDASAAGADLVLAKPYNFELLCSEVKRLLAEKGEWKCSTFTLQ